MSMLLLRRRLAVRAAIGRYAFAEPEYTLPAGMSYNAVTAMVDGTVMDTRWSATVPLEYTELSDHGSRSANHAALTAAISAAAGGTGPRRVILAAGADYGGQYTLPVNTTSGWIHIEAPAIRSAELPEGVRVSASDATVMPKMYMTGISQPVFAFTAGNAQYRLAGLEVALAPSGVSWYTESSGDNVYGFFMANAQSADPDAYPHGVILDRCYIHGTLGWNCKRAVFLNGARIAVVDCRIDEVVGNASLDGQCFLATSGPGPYKLINNYMAQCARGEHIVFGGGNAYITPSDIEVQRNHLHVPWSWYEAGRSLKNIYEMKVGWRTLVQANVLENYLGTNVGNQYLAMTLKSVDQNGLVPGTGVRDCTVRLNEFRNVSGWLQLAAQPELGLGHGGTAMHRVEITSNRILDPTRDLSSATYQRLFQTDLLIDQLRVRHNTARRGGSNGAFVLFPVNATTNGMLDQEYTDNLWVYEDSNAGLWWRNAGPLVNQGMAGYNAVTDSGALGVYRGNATTRSETLPPGNVSAASIAAASLAPATFALLADSPLRGMATAGRDPGALHALIDMAVAGVA